MKKIKDFFIDCYNKIKDIVKDKKKISSYMYIIYMAIPFLVMDLFTRIFEGKNRFFSIFNPIPILFTLIYIMLILGIVLSFKGKKRKIVYVIFICISLVMFLVNNVYFTVTNTFFDFRLLEMAGEASGYMLDTLMNANKIIYIVFSLIVIGVIFIIRYMPNGKKTNYKIMVKCFLLFLVLHLIIPIFLGKADTDLTWSTWKNPKNVYISFNDNNKSMSIVGLYEYMVRNFYVTYIREDKTDNEEEREFLDIVYNNENEIYSNKYTGKFANKNIILVQMEGLDSWLLNEKDTPNLYKMLNNSIVFNNHYSYYNGGGSTFNSEFAVNTGFITPISYNQNAYTFNKNTFDYTLAKLFKNEDYSVNAFHMNTSEYYSRGTNYNSWGYDNYYGLKDLGTYKDSSYELDRELVLNEVFNEKLVNTEGRFLDYIITYSNHTPFSINKGVCKTLVYEDVTKDLTEEEIKNKEYEIPELTEEDCARRQASETDYMIGLLLDLLEEKGVMDDTVIVLYADHYLYTLSDLTILDKYKDTSNNLINHTPFFIYSTDISRTDVNEVTSQLNILPTILNLFGISYNPNYYIGSDALNPSYKGYVFFSDYSWYDGNVYVKDGEITNGKYMSSEELEEKNYNINYIIKKNDLTLKYNYFKILHNKEKV